MSSVHTNTDIAPERNFGRRTFLKGTAATLGLVALTGTGCAPKQQLEEAPQTIEAPEEQIFSGVCRGNCFGGCSLKITVRDGKVVSTMANDLPDARYKRICQRGHSHLQRIYDPKRLKTPVRRVGERGAGEWEQISWDEAIEEITTKWKQYREESGNESIGFMIGTGNFGTSTYNYPMRLREQMSATNIVVCYDNAYFGGNAFAQGTGEGFYGNEIADILNAKTIFLWGSNPSESQPQNWHFIAEAHAAGAKLVCIDPNYTVAASRSDIHVTLRPGTDSVLIMAMLNIAVENGWTDPDFIKKGSVGPFLVKESDGKFLRKSDLGIEPTVTADPTTGKEVKVDPLVVRDSDGKIGTPEEIADPVIEGRYDVEGVPVTCAYTLLIERCKEWTPARAAEICDIPEETIQEIAKLYAAEGPSTIYQGFGADHYVNGHKVYFNLCAMAAVTGNMGKSGGSCGYDWTYAGYINFVRPAPLMPKDFVPGPKVPATKIPDIAKDKQLEGKAINLRSLYIWTSNPVSNQTDRTAWLEAFDNLDLVVVADMTMNDTTMYADIVLPVVHWFESIELMAQTSPYLLLQEQAIDPLYESKTDVDIINLLGNGMGFKGDYDYTLEEYLAATLNNPAAEAKGVTWDRLKEEKCIPAFSTSPYVHGANGVFPTASKREQFYLETPVPFVDYGQAIDVEKERLPYWEPPHEAWTESVDNYAANELSSKYPLIYTTERNKMKCHTQWGHSPWMLELYSEPVIRMNPADAEARGIVEGDYVRAFNDRGDAVFKAVLHAGARPGLVIVPKGWEVDQFKEGHYSNLTSREFNPACANNCYFDSLIEVEKA